MAVIKAVSSKAGIGQAIDYVTKEEKTEEKLVSGLHCEAETAKEEMQATKELWEKTGGRTYKHFVQIYHKDEKITPEQAHRNALQLAENTPAWKGFSFVERELRGIDEAVKSRTSKGRAEQAERRRIEQAAHQRAEEERRAVREQQRTASERHISRNWEPER